MKCKFKLRGRGPESHSLSVLQSDWLIAIEAVLTHGAMCKNSLFPRKGAGRKIAVF